MIAMRGLGWRKSFYWRIAVSFLALVLLVILAQSLMFSVLISQPDGPFAPGNPNATAAALAATLGRALERDAGSDLDGLLRQSAAQTPQGIYLVMRDGRTAATSTQPLDVTIARQARNVLDGVPPEGPNRPTGPVVSAPVHVDGRLLGLLLMPPPERGVFGELGRLMTLPGTIVLVATAALAALVVFAPARRRLRSLEHAAERLGQGDLAVRAAEDGGDEIARVAASFNRMASDLSARDQALRASNETRRQMLADVSHELKTPLTAMGGFLDTLTMEDVPLDAGTRARYLATVRHETARLQRIVADLLDLAKHESRAGTLDVRLFDVERVFGHVVQRHERRAAELGVTMRTQVEPGADQLLADPDRIEQVIDNLVANALRHIPFGGVIDLRAAVTPSGRRLVVMDSGVGIPPQHQEKIFERFYKAESARTTGAGGSGLGLSIVKAIVERHGGTIAVESRTGHTAFTIDLPQFIEP